MIDLKFIRQSPDVVKDAARRKRIDVDVDRILALDETIRGRKFEAESVRAKQNAASKRMPSLAGEEKALALAEMKELSRLGKQMDAEIQALEGEVRNLLLLVPSPPAPEVPHGPDETGNVELRRHGEPPQFDFEPRDHLTICSALGMLDIERAARIAGSRTYYLKNDGALLELAVLRLALERMVARGFTPMLVPHLVRPEAMTGTAYFPGGEEQAYAVERDGLWLIGTAEVPLTALYMGEILDPGQLPLRLVGLSSCFRREAGAAGRDTKGLYRIHQFQKVEQVIVCENDEAASRRFHGEILANSEEIVRALELPYRVVNVCDGDLGRGQVQKFDIECWMPSRKAYGETHSASRFHEFQARRLDLRYRDSEGRVRFCHTLNNTVIASPRILIPLLEIHQQRDGTIRIPEALRPYMGGRAVIGP